jgi:transcriptional regulator GlxA family with amidase domain
MPDGGIFGRYPKYGREIQNELIENVVRMLPHSLQPLLSKYSGGAARRHADELEEFVSQHFSDPRLSAKVMAKGIGVSDRTLRESCHRIYQQGPDEVLRRMRLDIAHRRLENPLPGDTDTRVAHETGFRDFRRFVKHYKEAYHGESPRETLQRGLAKAKGGAT